jgi:hypothetical protein
MFEALPAVGTSQEDAAERGQDAPPDGGRAWPGRRSGSGSAGGAFPPQPQVLEEGEGELAQGRVVVQAAPGTALEVIEAQPPFICSQGPFEDAAQGWARAGAGATSGGCGPRSTERAKPHSSGGATRPT